MGLRTEKGGPPVPLQPQRSGRRSVEEQLLDLGSCGSAPHGAVGWNLICVAWRREVEARR